MSFLRWMVTGFALVIFCGPLLQLALESRVIDPQVWSHLKSYQLPSSLAATLIFALGSALVALIIGALWMLAALMAPHLSLLFTVSMALLLALPAYVYGFVALAFLDFSGPVQTFIMRQFGDSYFFEPRTHYWAVFLFGIVSSPYVYFSLQAGMKSHIQDLLEASVSLGSGFRRTLRYILLPTLNPWALGGAGLVALEACADFGFVDLFGINTLSRLLYKSWGSLFSFGGAARISLILLLICLILMWTTKKLARNGIRTHNTTESRIHHLFRFGFYEKLFVFTVLSCGLLLFNALPLLSLLFYSADMSYWQELPWMASLLSTVLIGLSAATLSGCLIAAVYFLNRHSQTLPTLSVLKAGYGLPGTLLAVAFYIFYSRIFSLPLSTAPAAVGLLLLSLVYFSKFGGLMWRGLQNRRQTLPLDVIEAARGLGTPARTWWQVEFALYQPALTLGFFLIFLETVKELPAALMIRPFAQPGLSLRIHQYAAESDWSRAAVFSLVLVLLVLTGLLLQNFLVRYYQKENL